MCAVVNDIFVPNVYSTNMKILLTGATGYIGKRLLPVLIKEGHEVLCCVRDSDRFKVSSSIQDKVTVIENDLLDLESLSNIPKDINVNSIFGLAYCRHIFEQLYFGLQLRHED